MVSKEEILMTKHAQDEANEDGISRVEIAEAISRGPRVPESNHFITVYRHFTVVYERLPDKRYKIITVHIGRPLHWKGKYVGVYNKFPTGENSEHAQKPHVSESCNNLMPPVYSRVVFDKMKCTACNNGTYKKSKVKYDFIGQHIGVFEALVCTNCKETIFESDASDKIEAEVKRRGLWGLRARSKISKVGNALDVRIPKALAEFLELKKRKEVVLEPIDKNRLQIIVN